MDKIMATDEELMYILFKVNDDFKFRSIEYF